MNIVALGTSGTYPRYNQACSGYLFENDPTFVQVDLGTGSLANLFRHMDPARLTGIILTHLHADHTLDIYPLRYYLQFNHRDSLARIPVYLPEGGSDVLHAFNPGKDDGRFLETVFEFRPIGDSICLGSMRFYFRRTNHIVPTYALVCEVEGKRAGYTSDTSYDEDLIGFFEGCEVLICEAAYQGEKGKPGLHMTAREAGLFAARAGVKRLFLTHIWPEFDPHISLRDARDTFGGEVHLLKEHMIVEV